MHFHIHRGGRGPHHAGPHHGGPGRRGPFDPFGGWDIGGLGEGFGPSAAMPGFGGRGGRGRRRMFDGGELRLVLLKLMADQPRHGYDLIREIEALTGGAYAPSPGVVYPTLTLLEDMGQIAPRPGETARKAFEATAEGQAHLAENAEQVAALIARLAEIGQRRAARDSSSIRRAMGNLRQVLANQLSGESEDEKLQAIVALIDEAAQKIERL